MKNLLKMILRELYKKRILILQLFHVLLHCFLVIIFSDLF